MIHTVNEKVIMEIMIAKVKIIGVTIFFKNHHFINSIKTLSKNKTLLIISHDDVPLKICDKIYNIDEISAA